MRKALERLERYIRDTIRPRRTRRIEEDRERYLQEYRDVHNYLQHLHEAATQQESVVAAFQQRMGL